MPAKKSNKTKPNVSGRGLKAKATVPVWMVLAMVVLVVVLGVVVIWRSYAASYNCYSGGTRVGFFWDSSATQDELVDKHGWTCYQTDNGHDSWVRYLAHISWGGW